MPDLYGWITQQIDRRENLARRAAHYGRPDWPQPATSVVDLGEDWPLTTEAGPIAEHISSNDPTAVLRRCEADRRILARHCIDPNNHYEPACHGCGTYGYADLATVDNLNECPELLDLAHAHGITAEILAGLGQPETPARPERTDGSRGFQMPDAITESIGRFYAEMLDAVNATVTRTLVDGAGAGAPLGFHIVDPPAEPTPLDRALALLDPHLRRCPLYDAGPPILRSVK